MGHAYLSYFDPYGFQPYAYFHGEPFRTTDCQSLGLLPYERVTGYQIISAGPDGHFGTKGGQWLPSNAALTYPKDNAGADDWANFHRRSLGQPE